LRRAIRRQQGAILARISGVQFLTECDGILVLNENWAWMIGYYAIEEKAANWMREKGSELSFMIFSALRSTLSTQQFYRIET
jgi:hypothetical protein